MFLRIAEFGRTLRERKSKDRLQQVWHDLTALFVDDRSIRDGQSIHRLQQCQYIVLHQAGIKLVGVRGNSGHEQQEDEGFR